MQGLRGPAGPRRCAPTCTRCIERRARREESLEALRCGYRQDQTWCVEEGVKVVDNLEQILALHKKWVDGAEGGALTFRGAETSAGPISAWANLRGANPRGRPPLGKPPGRETYRGKPTGGRPTGANLRKGTSGGRSGADHRGQTSAANLRGQTSAGRSPLGQTSKPPRGGRPTGETSARQTSAGRTYRGQTSAGQASAGQTYRGQTWIFPIGLCGAVLGRESRPGDCGTTCVSFL